jgi:perosamine synthetase
MTLTWIYFNGFGEFEQAWGGFFQVWARTQLKISYRDLFAGLAASFRSLDAASERRAAEAYFGTGDAIATFSVRTGFDLLLTALDLKPGDEVIFSALNVKGMVRVVRELGLVPVPVDVDLATMAPRLEALERAITPQSRVFVAAHLFGARMDFDAVFACARKKGLLVVEDCAQAFNGHDYHGHPDADACLFSFGPIKTATALGGALVRIKAAPLRERMRRIESLYPRQSEAKQRKRIMQFIALKLVASRLALGAAYRCFRLLGRDYEDALADRVRDVAPLKTAKNLRISPSATLLNLMNRRLGNFDMNEIAERTKAGDYLRDCLGQSVEIPAMANRHRDYWAFGILVSAPAAMIAALRQAGFDAATLNRSQHIAAPPARENLEPVTAANALRDLVILPCYAAMPRRELLRMATRIKQLAATMPPRQP